MERERQISEHAVMTDVETAEYLRKPRKTLANWRHLGTGPRYVKVGNRVVYRRSDVETWLDEKTVSPGAA